MAAKALAPRCFRGTRWRTQRRIKSWDWWALLLTRRRVFVFFALPHTLAPRGCGHRPRGYRGAPRWERLNGLQEHTQLQAQPQTMGAPEPLARAYSTASAAANHFAGKTANYGDFRATSRSEEHTSELQSLRH